MPRLRGEGSMSERRLSCLGVLLVLVLGASFAHGATANKIDVLHYTATLEPDIANKSIKGTVLIKFRTNDLKSAEFNCGDLTIDSVRLAGKTLQFTVMDHRLKVSLPAGLKTGEIE